MSPKLHHFAFVFWYLTSHPVKLYLICHPFYAMHVSLPDLFIILLSLQGLPTMVDFWSLHLFALGCLFNSALTSFATFNQLFAITVHNPLRIPSALLEDWILHHL